MMEHRHRLFKGLEFRTNRRVPQPFLSRNRAPLGSPSPLPWSENAGCCRMREGGSSRMGLVNPWKPQVILDVSVVWYFVLCFAILCRHRFYIKCLSTWTSKFVEGWTTGSISATHVGLTHLSCFMWIN